MKFRLVRSFGSNSVKNPDDDKCYRVESAELMTAKEAMALLEKLGSPYGGTNE